MNIQWVDTEDPNPDWYDAAYEIANKAGIRILRDKELTAIAIEDDQPVGALFTGHTGGVYSFDVAVLPEYQGRGIGKALTDEGIQHYRDSFDEESGVVMEIDAVNPKMVEILKKRGFEPAEERGSHTTMKRATRRNRIAAEVAKGEDRCSPVETVKNTPVN